MLLLTMGVGLQQAGEVWPWQRVYRAASFQAGVSGAEGLTGPHWDTELVGRIFYDLSDITPRWE